MPKAVGVAIGKLSTIEPPTTIIPISMETTEVAVLAGC